MKFRRFPAILVRRQSPAGVERFIGVCVVCGADIAARDFEAGRAVLIPAPDYLINSNRDVICRDCEKMEVHNVLLND